MYLTWEEWRDATGGEILAGDPDAFVGGRNPGGLSIDSRSIEEGQWFIALSGKTGRDGHDYLQNAIASGATGLIVSDRDAYEALGNPDFPALLVSDTTLALGDAARALLEKFNPYVIAITGTVGKTSVKEAVAHIAGTKWPVIKNPHNWNTEIGLPLTIFNLTPEHRIAVLECASRGKGQIQHLSTVARPHVAVITSIGPGHLSEFGTIDDVARAKWEIIDGLRDDGAVIAPGDSKYTAEYKKNHRTITFGDDNTSNVYPTNPESNHHSTFCTFVTPSGNFQTRIPGTSRADLVNAACSTAIALEIEINKSGKLTLDQISESLRTLPSTQGRMEMISRPTGVEVIFDAYNSNPISLENALNTLASRNSLSNGTPVKRRVAILGDMLELGESEIEYHRSAGHQVAELPIDVLITVGTLASTIRMAGEKARGKGITGEHFTSTVDAAFDLHNWIMPGDLVLIKASRSLEFEKLLEEDW